MTWLYRASKKRNFCLLIFKDSLGDLLLCGCSFSTICFLLLIYFRYSSFYFSRFLKRACYSISFEASSSMDFIDLLTLWLLLLDIST